MIEEIEQISKLIAKLPGTAMWVLLGFAIYKLITYLALTGSFVTILRLLINKIHDAMTRTKVKIYNIDGHFIEAGRDVTALLGLLEDCKDKSSIGSIRRYIHTSDIQFVRQAIAEKRDRIAKEKADKRK